MEPIQIIIAICALLMSFFAFLGAGMMGVIGYFLKNFHSEYKKDKELEKIKDKEVDSRLNNLAETFAAKLEAMVEKFGEKINLLPRGSDSLSQAFLQQERDLHKRLDEHSQRIQNNYSRVEGIALRLHDVENAITGPDLMRQIEKRRAKALAESGGAP